MKNEVFIMSKWKDFPIGSKVKVIENFWRVKKGEVGVVIDHTKPPNSRIKIKFPNRKLPLSFISTDSIEKVENSTNEQVESKPTVININRDTYLDNIKPMNYVRKYGEKETS